jgi:hypothetical protein
MVQQLARHANARFQHPLISDESWTAYNYTPSRMWMMARSNVGPIARPANHPRKTIMTIFFGIHGIALIDILPEKNKLNNEYFRENIIKELDPIVYPAGRKPHATRMCLHFDYALVHNIRTVA